MHQTRLPIDWIVEAEQSSSSSEAPEDPVKRGRKARPLQWTRVKSMTLIREQQLMVYDGDKDLNWDKHLKVIRRQASVAGGEFVFDPDSLREEARAFRLDAYRLSQEELLAYGKLASSLRQGFTARARALEVEGQGAADDADVELPASATQLNRGCKKERPKRPEQPTELDFEAGCGKKRRRKMTKTQLSSVQLQRIAKLVLEDGLSQVDAAHLCNVTPALVCKLVKTVR